jgi:hypothetical protein
MLVAILFLADFRRKNTDFFNTPTMEAAIFQALKRN